MAATVVSMATFAPFARGADSISNSTELGRTNSFTLPSHLDANCFYLQAHIGDEGPFNLILDTGASYLAVSPQVAERLRKTGALRDAPGERLETASGKQPKMKFAGVRSVRLGDFIVGEARAAILDTGLIGQLLGETVDGLAGMGLFQTGTLVLDFPRREVRLEQGETRVTDRTVVLPCEFNGYLPRVKVAVAGREFEALVDSGFMEGFAVPGKGATFPFASSPVIISLSANATDITTERAARLATNIHWGGVTFERPIVRLSHTVMGMIGRKALEPFVVGLDQQRHRILLTPATNAPVPAQPVRSLGLSLLAENRGLKVMAVIPNTEASRSGIRRGDYISAINGQPAKEWNQKRLRELRDEAESFDVEMRSRSKPRRLKLKVGTLIE